VHKRFTDGYIRELIERYLKKDVERTHIQEMLGIQKRTFFQLIAACRNNPKAFSLQYRRTAKSRCDVATTATLRTA
jgi:hypothetical protein